MTTPHNIVFLDRDSLIATLRAPVFKHAWQDYPSTAAADVCVRLREATIAITNKVPLRAADLDLLPQLKMIAVAATGTDIVDLQACRERGILVANIRDYAGATVPEHTFALILALRRSLLAYRLDVEAGLWQKAPQFCLFGHPIQDLAGSRLGLIGYGKLGQAVARLGRAFGMEVCVFSRSKVTEPGITNLSLDALLSSSDVLSLHLPLNDQTRHMIDAPQLALMKPTALLINTARGGLVNEAALAAALHAGSIGGAGFDVLVTEPPCVDNVLLNLRLPNFILTPHIAWASSEAMQALGEQLIDNLDAYAAGQPKNRVA